MATASNVQVAKTGNFYGAPTGTALPTAHGAALDAAFADMGYISESGVNRSTPQSTQEIKSFQNGDIVEEVITSDKLTYAIEFMEDSENVRVAIDGNWTAGAVEIKGGVNTRQSWCFDFVMSNERTKRIVIPDGKITAKGDTSYVNGNAVIYPVTITCFPDGSGNKAYEYTEQPA